MNDSISQAPRSFGSETIHVDALPRGTMLAEFEILGLLGIGGFGMVYRAYDHSLRRTVAVKEYMPTATVARAIGTSVSLRSSVDQASFSAGLVSFVAEARLLAQFDHPSLVKVHRFWEANNTAYMAMPLYIGMTLKQARGQMDRPPSEAWLRQVLWPVLDGLKALHASNTIHRDVSPDNIFLQDSGPPVLLDLGSARRAVLATSQKQTAILKVNYAPIEQYADAMDLLQGPWTDLYSIAAVVHGCLCNEAPLPATFRVLCDRMPGIASVARTVEAHFGQSYSAEFVAALDHALMIRPDARPQRVDDFIAEMRLSRPADLLTFDWRADLAANVVVSGERPLELLQPPQPTMNTQGFDQNGMTRSGVGPAKGSRRSSTARGVRLLGGLLGLASLTAVVVASGWFAAVAPVGPSMPAPAHVEVITENPVAEVSRVVAAPPMVTETPPAPAAKSASALAKRVRAGAPGLSSLPQTRAPPVLCADSNFLTRSMCFHQECQKPEFAQLDVCKETRNRYAENPDRQNP